MDAPRFHHQWLPDTVFAERFAFSPDTRALLEARGYAVTEGAPWGIAGSLLVGGPRLGEPPPGSSAQSLFLGAANTGGMTMFGAPDPRGGAASAAGY